MILRFLFYDHLNKVKTSGVNNTSAVPAPRGRKFQTSAYNMKNIHIFKTANQRKKMYSQFLSTCLTSLGLYFERIRLLGRLDFKHQLWHLC